ncbi:MAG TPA: hypothetical protein VMU37_05495, partial [Caulobacteraceae bacterium]|nr:hypothetical protein [Caulobacteraceae bacterium]
PSAEPTASEVAAAAVIERLEAILQETQPENDAAPAAPRAFAGKPAAPEPAAPPPLAPPPPAPVPADPVNRPFNRNEIPFVAVSGPSRRRGLGMLPLLALGAVGVGLTGLGGFWMVQPSTNQVLGLAPGIAGLASSGPGVALAATAIYLLLDRIGRPRAR